MLDETTLVNVTNISGAPVVYRVPELNNVRREFMKGETKKISIVELRGLQYRPGGRVLLKDYLFVDSDELLQEFGIKKQEEHTWTEKDVKNVLTTGSLERLQDALDYAPAGIIEMIKEFAVSMNINDMSKRQAIFEATGFNVTKAIDISDQSKITDEDTVVAATEKPSQRRVPAVPKVTTDYKVTS